MRAIDFLNLEPTKNYLQDAAKAIGKVQQLLLAKDQNDWYRGLIVTGDGLSTQLLNNKKRITLNLRSGEISSDGLLLIKLPPQTIMQNLQKWLKSNHVMAKISQPEFITDKVAIDNNSANILADVNYWAKNCLTELKLNITTGMTSPVLLYPHHFDISLTWFRDKKQTFTFGFSIGDDIITQPYFYVTVYPETKDFEKINLPSPSFWQQQGFSGAILQYNDLVGHADPEKLIQTYFQTITSA